MKMVSRDVLPGEEGNVVEDRGDPQEQSLPSLPFLLPSRVTRKLCAREKKHERKGKSQVPGIVFTTRFPPAHGMLSPLIHLSDLDPALVSEQNKSDVKRGEMASFDLIRRSTHDLKERKGERERERDSPCSLRAQEDPDVCSVRQRDDHATDL